MKFAFLQTLRPKLGFHNKNNQLHIIYIYLFTKINLVKAVNIVILQSSLNPRFKGRNPHEAGWQASFAATVRDEGSNTDL